MTCKLVYLEDKEFCVYPDEINKRGNFYYIPEVHIFIKDESYSILLSNKYKKFIAIKKGDYYILKPLEVPNPPDMNPYILSNIGQFGSIIYHPVENVVVKTPKSVSSIPHDILKEIAVYSLIKSDCVPEMYNFEPSTFSMYLEKGATTIKISEQYDYETLWFKICTCMKMISSQGLIHRDIKADNILISDSGDPMIMDWGLATIDYTKNQTLRKSIAGTLSYMAPELLVSSIVGKKDAIYSYKVDIFSLGILFLYMIFKKPFISKKAQEIKEDISLPKKVVYLLIKYLMDPTIEINNLGNIGVYILAEDNRDVIYKNFINIMKMPKDVAYLLSGMLDFNPKKRLSYDEIIYNPFFKNNVNRIPEDIIFINNMPIIEDISIFWKDSDIPRERVIDIMVSLQDEHKRNDNVLFLSIQLLDLYVSKKNAKNIDELAKSALQLSSKLLMETSGGLRGGYEKEILGVLKGNILVPTLLSYSQHYGTEILKDVLVEYYKDPAIYKTPFSKIFVNEAA